MWLSLTHCPQLGQRPQLGTWPTTQACALTGNRTGDPLVFRPALSPLCHTSQDNSVVLSHPVCSYLLWQHQLSTRICLLLFYCQFSIVWRFHILFIHSSVNVHWGCFKLLALMYNASLNFVFKLLCGEILQFSWADT